MLPVIVIIAGVYLVVCIAAFVMQRQLIYHPYRQILTTPAAIGLEYHELKLQSPDGVKFVVWSIPAESSTVKVVYFHGNAENISNAVEHTNYCMNLVSMSMPSNIVAMPAAREHRQKAIETDVSRFRNIPASVLPGDAKIVAMGRSLGGAVAAKFAVAYPVDGIILESTFNRMVDVGRRAFPYLPISLLLRERYDSEEIVRSFAKPVLISQS